MSISSQADLLGIKKVSAVVASTLNMMRRYAAPGMSTKELDTYGAGLLKEAGARSAPFYAYGFPGCTCISLNHEVAHGIPSRDTYLKEGDLINIDVSAELDGFYADNGSSFVLGRDIQQLHTLVQCSRRILRKAIDNISGGVKIADVGLLIETEAKRAGFRVIKNLVGHGVGRSLHEEPREIPNYYDRTNRQRFKKNSVIALETFISTGANYVYENGNGWTYVTRDKSFVAQHEHTLIVTDGKPVILTAANGIG
jgi:methionyl aminopeptidase